MSKRKEDSLAFSRYFHAPAQPYRAANIELDYGDTEVLRRYIPTAKSAAALDVFCAAMEEQARDRAISLVAPYGSGKTSLLLFLCSLLENDQRTQTARTAILRRLKAIQPATEKHLKSLLKSSKGYVVVRLSGYQGDLPSLWKAGLVGALNRRRRLGRVTRKVSVCNADAPSEVLNAYRTASAELRKIGYKGIVVIYDEFGKVFESQKAEGRSADLFFLQSFAELCARSGRNQLLLTVTMHQGFGQYAQRLPIHVRNEWAKIEGRFKVVPFVEDSLQVYELIGEVLKQIQGRDFHEINKMARHTFGTRADTAVKLPIFSALKESGEREKIFDRAFPLHPLALYALPRLSARVSQNERTLFHFLLGTDEHCLLRLMGEKKTGDSSIEPVTVADLYGYFSELMASDMGPGGTHRRLMEMKAALDRLKRGDHLGRNILITIGLLSLLAEHNKAPVTLETLLFGLDAYSAVRKKEVQTELTQLVKEKIILYRRHSDEYRIWEGADVDLISILRQKKAEVERSIDVAEAVSAHISPPRVFPHRHNEKHVIGRVFEGRYVSVPGLERAMGKIGKSKDILNADGLIFYALADDSEDISRAKLLSANCLHERVLIAVPAVPLQVADLAIELFCHESLLKDAQFVAEDPVLRRELAELADDCLVGLRQSLDCFRTLRNGGVEWFHQGKVQKKICDQVELGKFVSEICNNAYPKTPHFNNELINRHHPTAVIVNARKKVIRGIINHHGDENFGLTGNGPDVTMFRAVYRNSGWYAQAEDGRWRFASPRKIQDPGLRAMVAEIHSYFDDSGKAPSDLRPLVEALRRPPFGAREGVLPLVLAGAFLSYPLPLNLMEKGIYVKEVNAEIFETMLKAPEDIQVQAVPLPEHVTEYLEGIRQVFASDVVENPLSRDIVRGALEGMYRWVHRLPPCSLQSASVTGEAKNFREILLRATDPINLLFTGIPQALGVEGKRAKSGPWLANGAYQRVLEQLGRVRLELDEVPRKYLGEVARLTRRVFDLGSGGIDKLRGDLQAWVASCPDDLKEYLDDPQCTGFLERVLMKYDTDEKVGESLASLVTGRSLTHWEDFFVRQYELGLVGIKQRLLDVIKKRLDARYAEEGEDMLRERIPDPVVWDALDMLSDEDRERLAYYLWSAARKRVRHE